MPAGDIRIVLVRPQGAVNAGAVARVMKNMGLHDLVLVRPTFRRRFWARTMAVHAVEILENARICETLAEAVADCGLVAGTTCRQGPYRNDPMTPRDAAPKLVHAAAANKVALVFGPEDHGLSNRDLQLMQMLITIPSHDAYQSLNLAQAVAVCCYEIFIASPRAEETEPVALATSASTEMMFERLQRAFLSIGFLLRDNPEHIMYAFRSMLGRAQLEERDVRILLGLARQIEWFSRTGGKSEEERMSGEPRTLNPEP